MLRNMFFVNDKIISIIQTYLQSITVRLEEWRLRRRDTESWMRHRQLPNDLQERVRKFVQYKWLATRGVDEESILRNLPSDLRRDIQRHLCLDLVRRVRYPPFLEQLTFVIEMKKWAGRVMCLGLWQNGNLFETGQNRTLWH